MPARLTSLIATPTALGALEERKNKRHKDSDYCVLLELACNQQRPCAVGFAPVILCKAGVPALIRSRHVEDLQAPVLPDEHPEEKKIIILPTLRRKELHGIKYSAQYEGQKSRECYSTDMWVMKNDERALNACQYPNGYSIWFSEKENSE